jgi:hypothetical protein
MNARKINSYLFYEFVCKFFFFFFGTSGPD